MAKTNRGPERIREYVLSVKHRGLRWADVGPTLRGWVAEGVPEHPQDGSLTQLDELMDWELGSARIVFEGGEPMPRQPVRNDRAVAALRQIAAAAQEAADALEADR